MTNEVDVNREKYFPQVAAALAATGGHFVTGISLAWSSQLHGPIVKNGTYNFNVTDNQFSWMGSALNLGAASTCVPIGYICDMIGRKNVMLGLSAPFLIGWSLVCGAICPIMVILGRFLLGMSCGGFSVVVPMYIGEISSKNIRGLLGTFIHLMMCLGVLMSNIFGAYVNLLSFNLICLLCTCVIACLFIFLPETPAYYVSKDKDEKAKRSIRRLRGKNYDVTLELAVLKADVESRKIANETECRTLCQRYGIKVLFIGMGLIFFQIFSGITVVIFYSGIIFMVRFLCTIYIF